MSKEADFEKAFAGAIFDDAEKTVVQGVKAGVDADWFTVGKWRLAWCAAVLMWKHSINADAALIVAEAKRLASADPKRFDGDELTVGDAADALNAGTSVCAAGYIAQLKGALILRSMRKAIETTFKESTSTDPELACEQLVNRLYEILSRTMVARSDSFADLVDRSLRNMREAHQIYMVERRMDYVPGLPTPWWQLTKMLNGLVPGFHVLGARTSVGKTSFALQLVRFFAERGLNVGFVSLDMNTRSFVDRFIAESSRVSLFKANFGHTGDRDMAKIEEAAKKVRAWPVTVFVEYDVDRIFNWCRVRKSAKLIDVLFVDFVQLLSYRGSDRATDTGRMTRVSKTLKRIVNEIDIPVIGLSQLNRDCERDGGREPMKADLRESGALEQDATTVWLLYHDKGTLDKFRQEASSGSGAVFALAAGQKSMMDKISPTWLKIDKNQNGGLGRIPFVVYSNYFTWMLADHEAPPVMTKVGIGATAKEVADYYPMFKRVHADWRKSAFEDELQRFGALLAEDLPPKNQSAEDAVAQTVDAAPFVPAPVSAPEQDAAPAAPAVPQNLPFTTTAVRDDLEMPDDDDYVDPSDDPF